MNKFSNLVFLIVMFGILSGDYLNAQTPLCSLQIEIFERDSQPPKAIEKVEAILTDSSTKKEVRASTVAQNPIFDNLVSGKYKVEIIKDGYQRRIKNYELSCREIKEITGISKIIYLHKGNVETVTKFDENIFGTKDGENFTEAKSDKTDTKSLALIISKPKYPAAARAVRATGAVEVQITFDEDGDVTSATAISDHPLLRQAAKIAAKASRFRPTTLVNQPVKVTGIVVYNFNP